MRDNILIDKTISFGARIIKLNQYLIKTPQCFRIGVLNFKYYYLSKTFKRLMVSV